MGGVTGASTALLKSWSSYPSISISSRVFCAGASISEKVSLVIQPVWGYTCTNPSTKNHTESTCMLWRTGSPVFQISCTEENVSPSSFRWQWCSCRIRVQIICFSWPSFLKLTVSFWWVEAWKYWVGICEAASNQIHTLSWAPCWGKFLHYKSYFSCRLCIQYC